MALPESCFLGGSGPDGAEGGAGGPVSIAGACANQWPTLQMNQDTDFNADVTLLDLVGNPIQLDPTTNEVTLTALEVYGFRDPYFQIDCPIVDGPEGIVNVNLGRAALPIPGLFLGEFAVTEPEPSSSSSSSSSSSGPVTAATPLTAFKPGQKILHRLKALIDIPEDLTSFNMNKGLGALSIAEIRLGMRDLCPDNNFLLEAVAFSNTEIAWSIRQPIDHWNETPPPIETFTPSTFPFRYHWIQGTIGKLYSIAYQHQERNRLQYSAAGVAVNESDKFESFGKISSNFWDEWVTFVYRKKREMNYEKFYGLLNIPSFGTGFPQTPLGVRAANRGNLIFRG